MTKGAQTQTCPFLDKQQNQEQSKPQLESRRALQPRHFASREPSPCTQARRIASWRLSTEKPRLVRVTSWRRVYYESAHSTHLSISVMADTVWATISKKKKKKEEKPPTAQCQTMPRAYMKTPQFPRQQSGMKNKKEEKKGKKDSTSASKSRRRELSHEATLLLTTVS